MYVERVQSRIKNPELVLITFPFYLNSFEIYFATLVFWILVELQRFLSQSNAFMTFMIVGEQRLFCIPLCQF